MLIVFYNNMPSNRWLFSNGEYVETRHRFVLYELARDSRRVVPCNGTSVHTQKNIHLVIKSKTYLAIGFIGPVGPNPPPIAIALLGRNNKLTNIVAAKLIHIVFVDDLVETLDATDFLASFTATCFVCDT